MLSHGQEIALDHYLREYPVDYEFEEILKLIKKEDDEIARWTAFLKWDSYCLITHIDLLASKIDDKIVNIVNKVE